MTHLKPTFFSFLNLLSSFFGYLEWGKEQSSFLFQVERDLLFGALGNTNSFSHPMILLPILGQLLLLISLFPIQKRKWFFVCGFVGIGLLMFMILLSGALSLNVKIVSSVLPFWAFGGFAIRQFFRRNAPAH